MSENANDSGRHESNQAFVCSTTCSQGPETAPISAPPSCDSRPAGGNHDHANRGDGRDSSGRIAKGSSIGAGTRFQSSVPGPSLKHGERSWLVKHALAPGQETLREALALDRAAIVADLGGDVSTVTSRLIDSLLETIALKTWCAEKIATVGPWADGGRQRPVVGTFLKCVEVQRQLSVSIGTTRTEKVLDPIESVRRAVAEANK
jgi:hypothetical protein